MFPPSQGLNLDAEAISGILGSISIACWVTVFTPQILENFRRSSAESLSVEFIVIWSLGDLCNVFGGILQGVLPTMLILAIYYVLADIVLIWQCLYYRAVSPREDSPTPTPSSESHPNAEANGYRPVGPERRHSAVDPTHLSPATPLAETDKPLPRLRRSTPLQAALLNSLAVLMVAGAGVFGWWVSTGSQRGMPHRGDDSAPPHHEEVELPMDFWGQVFGYGCMVMYLGSRVPQILLNWRRQSTEGLSGMFFLFACLGNVTYFLSILAFEPSCVREEGGCEEGEAGRVYARYMLVNLSWLVGSIGCLVFDFGILLQFIWYSGIEETSAGRLGERTPLLNGSESRGEL